MEYDQLHRPLNQFVRGTDGEQSDFRVLDRDVLFQETEYGEGYANNVALNLRTRAFRSYYNAGIVNSEEYDFKGNLLRAHGNWRRTTKVFRIGQLPWSCNVQTIWEQHCVRRAQPTAESHLPGQQRDPTDI